MLSELEALDILRCSGWTTAPPDEDGDTEVVILDYDGDRLWHEYIKGPLPRTLPIYLIGVIEYMHRELIGTLDEEESREYQIILDAAEDALGEFEEDVLLDNGWETVIWEYQHFHASIIRGDRTLLEVNVVVPSLLVSVLQDALDSIKKGRTSSKEYPRWTATDMNEEERKAVIRALEGALRGLNAIR